MKLQQIILYFGNGECIAVDGKYVGLFLVDEIKQTISRSSPTSIDVSQVAHQFAIEIHKDANIDIQAFDDPEAEIVKLFDRLQENDLASIYFALIDTDNDNNIYEYEMYLPWDEKDEYVNLNQETLVSKWGHIYITVDDTGDKSIRFKQNDIDKKGANQELNACMRGYKGNV